MSPRPSYSKESEAHRFFPSSLPPCSLSTEPSRIRYKPASGKHRNAGNGILWVTFRLECFFLLLSFPSFFLHKTRSHENNGNWRNEGSSVPVSTKLKCVEKLSPPTQFDLSYSQSCWPLSENSFHCPSPPTPRGLRLAKGSRAPKSQIILFCESLLQREGSDC
jgi:hypothetical protein